MKYLSFEGILLGGGGVCRYGIRQNKQRNDAADSCSLICFGTSLVCLIERPCLGRNVPRKDQRMITRGQKWQINVVRLRPSDAPDADNESVFCRAEVLLYLLNVHISPDTGGWICRVALLCYSSEVLPDNRHELLMSALLLTEGASRLEMPLPLSRRLRLLCR